MKIKDIFSKVAKVAPEEFQSSWDNSGIQVAGEAQECGKLAVCLEPTPAMMRACLDWGAQAVITHHPLYMKPKAPLAGAYMEVLRLMIKSGAWLYAAHTSLDVSPSGPAFWLGTRLGLTNTRILEPAVLQKPVEVSFYCEQPISRDQAEIWANHDGVHTVAQSAAGEVRMVVDREHWANVKAGIEFSTGQSPEYYVRSLEAPVEKIGFGQVGTLPEPLLLQDFLVELESLISRDVFTVCGPVPESISTVAYCGGSGSSMADAALAAGADVLVTGDMKYHPAVETGVCVVDVGHFSLEEEMMRLFAAILAEEFKPHGVEVEFFRGEEPFAFHVRTNR